MIGYSNTVRGSDRATRNAKAMQSHRQQMPLTSEEITATERRIAEAPADMQVMMRKILDQRIKKEAARIAADGVKVLSGEMTYAEFNRGIL